MEIDQPRVSIILPTYNRAELLSRAIESVLAQTYNDWELIIWDDGSTDDTRTLCYSFEDNRIRYFYENNHGVSYARNRALEKASGSYIAFLDSDDVWAPGKLLLQIYLLEKHQGIGFLFGDFVNINLASGGINTSFKHNRNSLQLLQTTTIEEHVFKVESGFLESIAHGNYIATDTVIFRREILDQVKWFNEDLRNSEDFELWWRMGLLDINVAYTDQVLMTRYKPGDSLSSPGIFSTQNTLKALGLCLEHALQNGRLDLAPYLNKKFRNAWQNMIIAYGRLGNTRLAWDAFMQSLKYGFRPGSFNVLLKALFRMEIILSNIK